MLFVDDACGTIEELEIMEGDIIVEICTISASGGTRTDRTDWGTLIHGLQQPHDICTECTV